MNSPAQSNVVRRVKCEPIAAFIQMPERPQRVVSLVSGFTEAIHAMGLGNRLAGVSHYCTRYAPVGHLPVAGDYLKIDADKLREIRPDLILMTSGVQLGLARKLAQSGLPVFVLHLPDSLGGILENIRKLGALLGEMDAAHELAERMIADAAALRALRPAVRPRIYAELWFGRHPRMAGGLSFVHDILELAGGVNVLRSAAAGYLALNLPAIATTKPEAIVVFSEEDDHPVDVARLMNERGWTGAWPHVVIESGIPRGRNLIHDGPSLLETARWLRGELLAKGVLAPA
ncbi:MAG TPA: helical backbone metal receptor [Opitutaceae bacterium]|nr:helical backbone metal receptor [Opitutaceae bacterium]